jgi:PAS domain S-box-containing protein
MLHSCPPITSTKHCHPWAAMLDLALQFWNQTESEDIWELFRETAIELEPVSKVLLFAVEQEHFHYIPPQEGDRFGLLGSPVFPQLLLHHVRQTAAPVLAEQPFQTQAGWGQDLYWLKHNPAAMGCLPIRQGQRLLGAIYFECATPDGLEAVAAYLTPLCRHIAAALQNLTQNQHRDRQLTFLRQFQILAENTTDGIYLILNNRVEYLNPAMERLLGRPRQTLLHQSPEFYLDCIHPEDHDKFTQSLLEPFPDKGSMELNYRIVRPDGGIRYLRDALKAIMDESGYLLGFQGILSDMTDLVKTETALSYSEQTLRQLTDAIPGVVYQYKLSADGTESFLYVNQRIVEFTGHTPEEIAANPQLMWSAVEPVDIPGVRLAIQQSALCLTPFSVEYRSHNGSGEMHWFAAYSIPKRQPDGSIVWSGVMLNISDRKAAEQERQEALEQLSQLNVELEQRVGERTQALAQNIDQLHQEIQERQNVQLKLQASQQLNKRIIESSPNALYLYDFEQDKILYLSHQLADLMGMSYCMMSKQGIEMLSECIHPEDFPAVMEQLSAIQDAPDGGILEVEYRFQTEVGGWHWLMNRCAAFNRDEFGRVTQVIGVVQDIHQRKLTEEALRQSEARFRGCVESKAVGIFFLDKQGKITDANDRFLEMLGYSRAQLADGILDWHIVTPPEYWEVDQQVLTQVLSGESEVVPREKEYFHQNGQRIPILVSTAPLEDHEQVVKIVLDISDRKRVEGQLQGINEKLSRTNLELARATRLRDEFLANMSHELRTPLNAILGISEGLLDELYGPLSERQKKSIATVERSGQHLLELINDLLELAKIESGKLELHLSTVPIRRICDGSLNVTRPLALQKNILIDVDIDPELSTVQADERRMRQVLINLLSNAIKFTPEGGSVFLEVVPGPGRNNVHFKVQDTGIGIAPEDMSKLFQSFTQIDSSLNRQYTGTGLGLVLAKNIAELHLGKITVESKPNKGSCFTVILPWKQAQPTQSKHDDSPSPFPPSTPNPAIKSARILLAEDNEDNIDTFSTYLTNFGYEVICARNGQEAVKMAKSHPPQLILMDIQMPIMDGLEAMQLIRCEPDMQEIPILTLTALVMPGDRERCFAAGANEYLSKPIRLKQLAEKVQYWLEGSKIS